GEPLPEVPILTGTPGHRFAAVQRRRWIGVFLSAGQKKSTKQFVRMFRGDNNDSQLARRVEANRVDIMELIISIVVIERGWHTSDLI
ncbi:hypothetical protein SAMN05216387_1272, partial [Nitrosovibrio tenuis]